MQRIKCLGQRHNTVTASGEMDYIVFGLFWKRNPGPEVIKLFSCSTQLSTKFQLFIKTKIQMKKLLALSLSDVVFIMLVNVKMPTIFGILTFMSRINFMLPLVKHGNFFITSAPGKNHTCKVIM